MDIKSLNERLNSMPIWAMLLIVLLIVGIGGGVTYVVIEDYEKTTRAEMVNRDDEQTLETQTSFSAGVYFEPQFLTEATGTADALDVTPLSPGSSSPSTAAAGPRYPDQPESVDMEVGVNTGRSANPDAFFDSLSERLQKQGNSDESSSTEN